MVGDVLASFPLNKSRKREPIEEEPIPLVRRSVRPEASVRISSRMLLRGSATSEAETKRKPTIPPEEDIELVAPGMFRLPVSDDALTRKMDRPKHKDAIMPKAPPLPRFEDSLEVSVDSLVAEEEPVTVPKRVPHDTPADWENSEIATAELKSPEELRGDGSKSHISLNTADFIVGDDDEPELKSPEELRRSTRPPMTGEVPESVPLFSLVPGKPREDGSGDSSVNRSLKDLQSIEEDRQLAELEEQEERELEEKRAELLRALTEKRRKMEAEAKADAEKKAAEAKAAAEAAAKAKAAAEEAKRAEEKKRAAEEAARREADSDTTAEEIHVEIEDGILWEDDHTIYNLTEEEMAACEHALPNRKRRYILPVPEEESEFAAQIKAVLKDEETVELAGKSYYLVDREFAEAKIVARVGKTIHVWPSAMTNYEFLGNIGVDTPEYDEVEWPNEFFLNIRPEEMEMVNGLVHDNLPMLLHPVPPPYTKNPYNLKIMNDCDETPIVDIDGKEYYVLEPESMERWREIVLTLKDVRMVSRRGDKVSVWDKKLNGHSLFSCGGTCHLASYGQPGAPLLPRGHGITIEPYNAEALDIAAVFKDGERRMHLYPMPDKISGMEADKLSSLMLIASSYVEKEKHSPLISMRGRWYLAFEYPSNGTREAEYRDGSVKILKERSAADGLRVLTEMMQKKKEEREPPIVKLPMDPAQRVGLLAKFPEHAPRFLLQVDRDLESEVPDVWVKNGDGVARYLVYEKEMPGSFAVVRVGDEIKPQRK